MYGKYVCKSNLRELKKRAGNKYKNIPLRVFQEKFKLCRDKKIIITGHRFDDSRTRRTKVVNIDELLMRVSNY